ncbi:MAG: PAS domain S-box protein [Ignavibacteriae bacterium]|nr:PAS domain S-box protein [Ignavibacteriota bacterium]
MDNSFSSEHSYRQIFESAPEPMVIFCLPSGDAQLNTRAQEILGYSQDEITTVKFGDIVAPSHRFSTLRSLWHLKKKGKATFRTAVLRRSGRQVHFEVRASHLKGKTYVATCTDISDVVHAEREASQLQAEYSGFVNSLPYPYAIFVNRKLHSKNELFDKLFPWIKSEARSLSEFFGRRNAEMLKEISAILEGGGASIIRREVLIPSHDPQPVAVEVSAAAIQYQGKPSLYCTFVDVSERRKILDQAQQTEERFKTLIDQAVDAVSISQDGRVTLVNKAFVEMFGYSSPMDLLGKELTCVISGKNARQEFSENIEAVTGQKEATIALEYPGLRHDGTKLAIEARASRITVDDTLAVLIYHRDITALKKQENELLLRHKSLDILNRFSEEMSSAHSEGEILQKSLNSVMRAMQFESGGVFIAEAGLSSLVLKSHHGLSDKIIEKLKSQNMDEGFARFFSKTHEPIVASIADYPPYLHYKALFEGDGITSVVFLPFVVNADFRGLLLLTTRKEKAIDEFDRTIAIALGKQVNIALKHTLLQKTATAAEERFHATVHNITNIIYSLEPNGNYVYLSPNVERLIGFKLTDFQANAGLWRTLLHPDDRPLISQRISNQAIGQNTFSLEYRLLPKGRATYLWFRDDVRYTRDSSGNVVSIDGVLTDVTDTKNLADVRGQVESRSSSDQNEILRDLPAALTVFDIDGFCRTWNTALERMTGIAAADALGLSATDVPVLGNAIHELIEKVRSTEHQTAEYVPFVFPHSESEGEVELVCSLWRDGNGSTLGFLLFASQISGMEKLRREVTESEEMLRNVINAMGDALMISDLQGEIWEVNREFTRLTGYERDEVRLSKFPYPWLMEGELAGFIRWIADLVVKQHLHDRDMTWRHRDGSTVAVSLNSTLLRNVHGQPVAILNIARDISERRRVNLELQRRSKEIELLNRIISFANTTMDLDSIFSVISNEILSLIPYEGIAVNFVDGGRMPKPIYAAVATEMNEARRVNDIALDNALIESVCTSCQAAIKMGATDTETNSQITLPLIVNDKPLGTFTLTSSQPATFSVDDLSFLRPVADQVGAIVQRVHLFEQVRDDSTYIHNLLNSIDNIVYTVDAEYRITEVNKAWSEFMHRLGKVEWENEADVIGESLHTIIGDNALWKEYQQAIADLFAQRIPYFAHDYQFKIDGQTFAYHLVINPMIVGNRVNGLVFTQTDTSEMNRTEEEIKRRNKELVALNTIATSISGSLELEEVLDVASDQLREAFGARVVAFYLLDTEHKQLGLAHALGIPEEHQKALQSLHLEASLTGAVIAERRPTYITDNVATDLRVTEAGRAVSAALNLKSLAIVPLQSKDNVSGAFLISFESGHTFREKEQQLLVLIGNQIGAAIENAQLYSEVQRQVKTLTTLYELGKGLTGVLDLKSMLQVVYKEISDALPLERFYYQAYLPEQNTLSLLSRTMNGIAEFYPTGVKVRSLQDWPNTIFLRVVEFGTSYIGPTSNTSADSMIAVPIKSDEKVIGIISIVSSETDVYNHVHLRLLESIANLTGVAISKATLYEDTLKKSQEIENRNKELDDFTYVVSHDLKEPLISIEGYSKIVMKDHGAVLDDEGREYLGTVVQSASRMKNLIDDLLTLSRLGRSNDALESVSVKNIIDEVLRDFQFTLRQQNVVVTMADAFPRVRFSYTRLSMVFRNLISNAMKFNDKPKPTIHLDVAEDENEFVFSVADNGIGIDPQYFDRIFAIFQRLRRSEEYRGTGAGLTIAKKIVEREGGRIWVTSEPNRGSTFFFTIKKPG